MGRSTPVVAYSGMITLMPISSSIFYMLGGPKIRVDDIHIRSTTSACSFFKRMAVFKASSVLPLP